MNIPLRYPRTAGEAFRDASYADPIDRPPGRSLLASPSFLIGGLLSALLWVALWRLA